MTDPWADAVCRDHDPEWWFPDPGQHKRRAEAKRLCKTCPLQTGCANFGMHAEYGIWGGLDPAQRRTLRRRQADHERRLAS